MRKNLFTIGLAFIVGISFQVQTMHALYSPIISQEVFKIQQNVQSSQVQNGTQSILEQIEQIKAYDRANRANFTETGIAGDARVAQELILNTVPNLYAPIESLLMIFNFNAPNAEFISTCLRDEIWSLEALRDVVGSEMVKAYMLFDTFHGNQLKADYLYLVTNIDLLRRYGSDPKARIPLNNGKTIESTEYFFGNEGAEENYYNNTYNFLSNSGGCPEGEFQEAFREVVNSTKTLKNLSTAEGFEWGSIWAMAEANARIRAREWIRAKRFTHFGGEEGGRVDSLVKGGGWDRFTGNVKAQLRVARNMVGPVIPLWNVLKWTATQTAEGVGFVDECVFYYVGDSVQGGSLEQGGVFRNCDDQQKQDYLKCEDNEEEALAEGIKCERFRNTEETISFGNKANKQIELQEKNARTHAEVETAFIYSINLDSVAENNIYLLDEHMWDMNMHIKRGYEGVHDKAGESIPRLTKEIAALAANQCANK